MEKTQLRCLLRALLGSFLFTCSGKAGPCYISAIGPKPYSLVHLATVPGIKPFGDQGRADLLIMGLHRQIGSSTGHEIRLRNFVILFLLNKTTYFSSWIRATQPYNSVFSSDGA